MGKGHANQRRKNYSSRAKDLRNRPPLEIRLERPMDAPVRDSVLEIQPNLEQPTQTPDGTLGIRPIFRGPEGR